MSTHVEMGIYTLQIQRNPKDYEAYFNRGKAYQVLELYDLAVDDFSKAILINRNYAKAYHYRGVTYANLGNEKKAQEDFEKARELGYTADD